LVKSAQIQFNLAQLFFSREISLIAYAWDRLLYRGTITIDCKTLRETDPDVKSLGFVVPKSKSTCIEVHSLNVQLLPKAGKMIEMILLTHCDPKIMFAPSVLINFIFKSVSLA
jgi:hypothetical protein